MIRERSLLIKGLTFLLAVFILNIPFPNSTPLSHSVFSFLGLPLYGDEETMTGIQYASNGGELYFHLVFLPFTKV